MRKPKIRAGRSLALATGVLLAACGGGTGAPAPGPAPAAGGEPAMEVVQPGGANLDGMVVRLTATGSPDPGYGQGGRKLYDMGGPNDSLFGVALSPDGTRLAAVGYLGREASVGEKDDGVVLWLRP